MEAIEGGVPAAADTPALAGRQPPGDAGSPGPIAYDTLVGVPAPATPTPTPAPTASSATSAFESTPSDIAALKLGLVVPVQGVAVASLRDSYTEKRGTRVHEAMDILAPRGTPVVSATAGRVLRLHRSAAGGTMIYAADASDRFILLYGHLETYAPGLREGAVLVPGQQIGAVGTTGNAGNTPHLHFAVMRGRPSSEWWRGTPVNPYPLFMK